jgi:chemotaxis family two-component system response regulator Rcp1
MRILLIEDNLADVFLIQEALREHKIRAELEVINDGETAYSYWDRYAGVSAAPCPDLILLDINLPRRSGLEILERIRDTPLCAKVNVLIVSSSANARDVEEAKRLGIRGYFRKPTHLEAFLELGALRKSIPSGNSEIHG